MVILNKKIRFVTTETSHAYTITWLHVVQCRTGTYIECTCFSNLLCFFLRTYTTHTRFVAIFRHFPWLAGSPHPQMTMTWHDTNRNSNEADLYTVTQNLEFIGITMPYFKNELSTLYVLPTRQRTQTWSRGRQGHSNEVFQILWSRHDTHLFFPAAIEAARTWNQLVTARSMTSSRRRLVADV